MISRSGGGRARLLLIISAQTLDATAWRPRPPSPDQVIKVHVRLNFGRTVRKVAGWGLLMLAGCALNAWGRELYPPALEAVGWLWGLLGRWSL